MSWRKLVIDTEVWRWKTSGETTCIRGPDGKGVNVPGYIGSNSDDVITPKNVRDFIDANLRNKIDTVAILKEIFYGKRRALYSPKGLATKEKFSIILFKLGNSEEEDCWIALNYIKSKYTGYYNEALAILKKNPKFKKLTTKALLGSI